MLASKHRTAFTGAKLRSQRRRAQRPALTAVALLAFLLGGVAAGLVGFVGAVSGAAVRDTFDDVPVSQRVFQLSARVADDPAEQDETAVTAFDRFVGDAPYNLHRSLLTEARQLIDPSSEAADDLPRVALAAYGELADHAELTAGAWPSGATDGEPAPVAVHADTASGFGLGIGDELAFIERQQRADMIITGMWRPVDPAGEYWFGSVLETTGADERADGLAVVDEAALVGLPGSDPIARWRLVPDKEVVTAADLGELRVGLPRIRPHLADDPLFRDAGFGVADDIVAGLEGTDSALLASRSVAIAPLLLAVVAAAGAIGLVSRLLGENRLGETLLLRGRGWSRTQAVGWALLESLRGYVLPVILGGAAGYGVLRAFFAADAEVPAETVAAGVGVVIVAGLVTHVVFGARMARPAHSTIAQAATANRRQVLGRASAVVIVAAVAALAMWQLRRFDGVTVLDARGIRQLDPLAVAAPAAILLASAVAVAGVIVVLGWIAERVLTGRRSLAPVHAARVLARQPAAYVLPVVLIGLAAGSGTFAASYATTWHDLQGDVAAERTAADVEVELGGSQVMTNTIAPLNVPGYRAIDGVEEVVLTVSSSAELADGEVSVVATSQGAGAAGGIELPAGEAAEIEIASELQLSPEELGESDFAGQPLELAGRVGVWLVGEDGSGGVVRAGTLTLVTDVPATAVLEFELPAPDAGQWRVIGVDVSLELPPLPSWQADFSVSVADLRVGGASIPLPSDGWSAHVTDTPGQNPFTAFSTGAADVRLRGPLAAGFSGRLATRLAHGGGGAIAMTASDAALDRFGLTVGDEASLDVLGMAVPIEISGRTPSVSGAGQDEAFAVDLPALIAAVFHGGGQPPAPDSIWLTTDPAADQALIADAAAGLAGPDNTVTSRAVAESELVDSRLSQLVVTTFWLVSAVAAVLAAVGVWAGTASSLGARKAEVGVLRALGFSAAQQGRQRRREVLLLGLLATVLGGAAGYAAGWVTVPSLAGSATPGLPDFVEPAVGLDWPAVAGFGVALVVVLTVIVIAHGARVRRQADASLGVEVMT